MEFRLTYQGPLYASRGPDDARQSRLKHMYAIRRQFHEQLRELWNVDSRLKPLVDATTTTQDPATGQNTPPLPYLEALATHSTRRGIKFVPLVSERMGIACSLDILFLRHEPKGGIIQSGDLDNRINTLFDSLRVPDESQVPDDVVPQNEPPLFFCLLSNDKLIAEFRVAADRLLVPSQKPDADVHLVIGVKTFIENHEVAQWVLGAHVHR